MSEYYRVGDKVSIVGEVLEVQNLWMDVNIDGDIITFRTDDDIEVVERKKTPGQKAYEGFYRQLNWAGAYWNDALEATRQAWEAAAAAVTEES
jgi:hypothetical protein